MYKICFIIGEGNLPFEILKSYSQDEVFVIVLKEAISIDLSLLNGFNYNIISCAKVGSVIKAIKKRKITEVCIVGRINKPRIKSLRPDMRGIFLFLKILSLKIKGDNAILQLIVDSFKNKGINVRSPIEVAPHIIMQEGALTKKSPAKREMQSIHIGIKFLDVISSFDIGQAIVIQEGVVLGVEGMEGTDELIKRCGLLKYNSKDPPILVKAAKVGQTLKIDMPTIGKRTIDNLKESGFGGIALKAESSIIIERSECIKKADDYNIFIIGV